MNLEVYLSIFTLMLIVLGDMLLAIKQHLIVGETKVKTLALSMIFPLFKSLKPSLYLKYSPILLYLFLPTL